MIYAVQAGTNGPIKIGFAKDIKSRMASIQTGCPDRLTLLGTCEVEDDSLVEKYLHKLNSAFHLRGEWFKPGFRVLETVEAIQTGKAGYMATRHWAKTLLKQKGQWSTARQLGEILEVLTLRKKWHGRTQE